MRFGVLTASLVAMMIGGCAAPAATQAGGGSATSSSATTASATPSATVSPTATPEVKLGTTADAVAAGWLAGTPQPTYPAGVQGTINVVASGPITARPTRTSVVPVVVRNGTRKTVTSIDVTGAATDAAGKIIGSGNSLGFSPSTVPPGGIAYGFVYFESLIPEDARIKFAVGSKPLIAKTYIRDLTVDQANSVGGTITGMATNNHSHSVQGTFTVNITCFNESGELLTSELGTASPDSDLAPGQSVTYQVDLRGAPCPTFLVGVFGSEY